MARGLSQERNTALMAPISCSLGSVGKSSPILALYSALNWPASSFRSSAVSSTSWVTPRFVLHLVDELLKVLLAHLHDHVGVHLDKAAVAVPGPAGVAGLLGHDLHHLVVQAQVQDGVHHAGHGGPGAGTDGDQQGVLEVAELLAGDLLHLADILHDLRLDLVVDLLAVLIVLGAGLGGDGEALGHGQADVGHLGQVGALAAQQLTHVGVALREEVHILCCHLLHSFLQSWGLSETRRHRTYRHVSNKPKSPPPSGGPHRPPLTVAEILYLFARNIATVRREFFTIFSHLWRCCPQYSTPGRAAVPRSKGWRSLPISVM